MQTILEEDEVTVQLKMKEAGLTPGGRYTPKGWQSRQKVAIVVPVRNRKDHLTVFLHYMHPFLQRQQLNYVIIVVEQSGRLCTCLKEVRMYIMYSFCCSIAPSRRFTVQSKGANERGLQISAIIKNEIFQCFILHDVDMLPERDGNPYTCPEDGRPRQMAFSVDYLKNYS